MMMVWFCCSTVVTWQHRRSNGVVVLPWTNGQHMQWWKQQWQQQRWSIVSLLLVDDCPSRHKVNIQCQLLHQSVTCLSRRLPVTGDDQGLSESVKHHRLLQTIISGVWWKWSMTDVILGSRHFGFLARWNWRPVQICCWAYAHSRCTNEWKETKFLVHFAKWCNSRQLRCWDCSLLLYFVWKVSFLSAALLLSVNMVVCNLLS